jgi:hypothetical protein
VVSFKRRRHFGLVPELRGTARSAFAVGAYEGAARAGFNGTAPGLSVTADSRGCNQITGRFVVLEADFSNPGTPRFAANFEQWCDSSTAPVTGELRIQFGGAVQLPRDRPRHHAGPDGLRGPIAGSDQHRGDVEFHHGLRHQHTGAHLDRGRSVQRERRTLRVDRGHGEQPRPRSRAADVVAVEWNHDDDDAERRGHRRALQS